MINWSRLMATAAVRGIRMGEPSRVHCCWWCGEVTDTDDQVIATIVGAGHLEKLHVTCQRSWSQERTSRAGPVRARGSAGDIVSPRLADVVKLRWAPRSEPGGRPDRDAEDPRGRR